ncbi:GNAT family N-acetyltransferase [Dyella telluris]|uniref:GNAT family N-acetyltransferase n=1 Tax=Dyella telluris TaxID=2763498 RepID=A0A7G8Q3L3_9GAMM|nr:GNAT family N-acetyltransferase [Dyella telluris]QNK01371.1 GNAT family N-acetyltransferase [Dyella telluris]
MGEKIVVSVHSPDELSGDDRRSFVECILEGGEVNPATLTQLLDRAHRVAFAKDGGVVQGVAGLKNPNVGYRNQTFKKAGVPDMAEKFARELGWVYIKPQARRRGISRDLVKKLLEHAQGAVYATSADVNQGMHRVLRLFDFVPVGTAYASRDGARAIQLFVLGHEGRCGKDYA